MSVCRVISNVRGTYMKTINLMDNKIAITKINSTNGSVIDTHGRFELYFPL